MNIKLFKLTSGYSIVGELITWGIGTNEPHQIYKPFRVLDYALRAIPSGYPYVLSKDDVVSITRPKFTLRKDYLESRIIGEIQCGSSGDNGSYKG